ncbi:DUF411 domain-containing protein [Pokkaliibacter sp. MBI-7]|uniref:DUF411 domain-containing protein n=1 Tax=Pokkaliibacter sp. MBI-7 TaxID=3040600 RepID=UPI00244A2AF6|nr:DUF411 domain-containing protein [Pokkaliibacter sp. MBI-7]MDH2434598.1 DUF411 domain-containing protein [Pokkaliibacter sp. MBI-7]
MSLHKLSALTSAAARRTLQRLAVITLTSLPVVAWAEAVQLEVFKDPQCGCCQAWLKHMQGFSAANSPLTFAVTVNGSADLYATKDKLAIPPKLRSCHTAVETDSGYVFEGHVPAPVMARFLAEKPDARGLAVPGMPLGSPGMEMGERFQPYSVYLLKNDGTAEVYARIETAAQQY